jgi:hypothetical protein
MKERLTRRVYSIFPGRAWERETKPTGCNPWALRTFILIII